MDACVWCSLSLYPGCVLLFVIGISIFRRQLRFTTRHGHNTAIIKDSYYQQEPQRLAPTNHRIYHDFKHFKDIINYSCCLLCFITSCSINSVQYRCHVKLVGFMGFALCPYKTLTLSVLRSSQVHRESEKTRHRAFVLTDFQNSSTGKICGKQEAQVLLRDRATFVLSDKKYLRL